MDFLLFFVAVVVVVENKPYGLKESLKMNSYDDVCRPTR